MTGIITIAQGSERYIKMAQMLALSLIKNAPEYPRAIISDAPEEKFTGLFDIYIPVDPAYGKGLNQKLFLDIYSPFDETLFIDADSLVIKPLNNLIKLCASHSFVVLGDQINTGEWYMDVKQICERFNLSSIPLFNGGLYYFKKDSLAKSILDMARNMSNDYTQHELVKINDGVNEEPLISIALARNNVMAVNDNATGMRTPIGINGRLSIDVLKQHCYFVKEGVIATPAILHFSGSYADAFHYKRECAKLKLATRLPGINLKLIANMVNAFWNIPYALTVFCKRLIKLAIRPQRFDFKNLLPVFSNH